MDLYQLHYLLCSILFFFKQREMETVPCGDCEEDNVTLKNNFIENSDNFRTKAETLHVSIAIPLLIMVSI